MGRKNHRGGRPQARRRFDGSAGRARVADPPVETLVVPKGKCYFRSRSGKLIFATETEAQKALRQAQHKRRLQGTTHKEERYYPCPEGGCGGFHLTSRTQYQDRSEAS
jgi:hypothetical protein